MQQIKKRRPKDFISLTLRGILIGSADIVPGVSGGTMAFILGIYDELIDAVRSVVPFIRNLLRLRWREAFNSMPWGFVLSVGLGVGLAVLGMSRFLHWALDRHPEYIFALFFGLILASIFIVGKRVGRWSTINLGVSAIAALTAYLLISLAPAATPHTPLFTFISGALAVPALILPGLSGAFILMLLGKYQYLLGVLLTLDLAALGAFLLGAATGLVTFSNFLRWLLDHLHDLTIAALLGFMIGALRKVWPWKEYEHVSDIFMREHNILPAGLTPEVWTALGLMVLGVLAILAVDRFTASSAHIHRKDNL
jgi:putative membrane protein